MIVRAKDKHPEPRKEKTYKCLTCYSLFMSDRDLYQHVESMHVTDLRKECPYCHGMYNNVRQLREHIKNSHSDRELIGVVREMTQSSAILDFNQECRRLP